jgi:hypothetical protein
MHRRHNEPNKLKGDGQRLGYVVLVELCID